MANGTAPIYRSLLSAPLLGGIPAHYVLGLVSVAALLGFGLLSVTKAGGLAIVSGVLIVWGVLAVVFGQIGWRCRCSCCGGFIGFRAGS